MSRGAPGQARRDLPGSSASPARAPRAEAPEPGAGRAPGSIPSGVSLSAGRARAPGSAGPRESDPTRRRPGGAGGDRVAPHALRRGAGTALRVAWPQTMGRPPCAERGRWHCLPGAAEESSPPFLEGPASPGLDGALPLQAPGHLLKANERKEGRKKKDSHSGLGVCSGEDWEVAYGLTL